MNKKHILRWILLGEVFLFMCFYYHGAHGLKAVHSLQKENQLLEQKINSAQLEIDQLQQEINTWQSDPFYKEKLAREQLHMARDGEEIYLT